MFCMFTTIVVMKLSLLRTYNLGYKQLAVVIMSASAPLETCNKHVNILVYFIDSYTVKMWCS